MTKYYNGLNVLSYNAIWNFVISNRGYGKTWTFKKRAFRRGIKHGKKTIWVRRFQKEVKEAVKTFYTSNDLQKFCGIEWYDPKTKEGNLKQIGRTFFCKHNGKWIWFLKVCAVSDANAMRSADDVDCDTIVYDEHTTTPENLRRFRGNEVEQFMDMFVSAKREHAVLCIFLGNKEGYSNPYLQYHGIEPLPETFEGTRVYKGGAIVVQQFNNVRKAANAYDRKFEKLVEGTAYGRYLYNGETKGAQKLKIKKTPNEAAEYIQICFKGNEMKFAILDGYFYVSHKIDRLHRVYCDVTLNKYKHEGRLVKRMKKLFTALENAIMDNRVYYDSPVTHEAAQMFYAWLGI